MCRSIHTLYHTDPPATEQEIRAASLQFVRKISGYPKPSKVNEAAFMLAVSEVEAASAKLLASLATSTPPREHQPAAHSHHQASMLVEADRQRV